MKLAITLILLLILITVLMYTTNAKIESFGMSPGTMVQLASTHVPTEDDMEMQLQEAALVQHDIHDMTE
jgi:hypothetical protein